MLLGLLIFEISPLPFYTSLLVSSLLQHILTEVMLPKVEAEVAVAGEIAPGVPLETSPQWI